MNATVDDAVAPNWTVVAASKPLPVIVTVVPPPSGPAVGLTELIVGAGGGAV